MGNLAIRASALSKRYAITAVPDRHDTLRDQLVDGLKSWLGRGAREGRTRLVPTGPAVSDARPARQRSSAREDRSTVWAVRDVSFEVERGEIIGLIGRNGAGKSTLLKMLARITAPTSGRAELWGRVGSLLEVGTGFERELSGRENIYLSGAILGMKMAAIRRKFDEIVAFAELEKFIDTPVKRYSSGMYMRLAFAIAAHLEPEILLVDEVLAVGDAAFQSKCLGKMAEVRREGRTVLFVTHNMAMVENLCPRTILLRHGCVAEDGPTGKAIDRYLKDLAPGPTTPLADRNDRTGLGEISLVAVEFLDRGRNVVKYAASGQGLLIRVHYRCNTADVFRNCRVSVSLHKDERPYFLLSTELVDKRQLDLSGEGYIEFALPELPLSAGEYHANPFIESNRIVQDWVVGAAALSVIDGDFYGTGRNYPWGWQGKCVLVKFGWSQSGRSACPGTGDGASAHSGAVCLSP